MFFALLLMSIQKHGGRQEVIFVWHNCNTLCNACHYWVFLWFSLFSAAASSNIFKKHIPNASEILTNKSESKDLFFLSILFRLLWSRPIFEANHLIDRRCSFNWRLISWQISIYKSFCCRYITRAPLFSAKTK